MSKIEVTLTAVLHTDKGMLQPGESVSLDEAQARRLAALGMVKLPMKNGKQGKTVKSGGNKAAKTAEADTAASAAKLLDEAFEDSGDDAQEG